MPAKYRTIVRMVSGDMPEVLLYGLIDDHMSQVFAMDIQMLKVQGCKEAVLRINSNGGNVSDGVAMYNTMRTSGIKWHVRVDGAAASMASVLAFAGETLEMSKYARLMMHKPSGGAWGNADELRAMAEYIDSVESDMLEIYAKRTGLSTADVQAKFFNGKDNFFTAKQAKQLNLIDGIYDGEDLGINDSDDADVQMVFSAFQAKMELKANNNMDPILTPEVLRMLGVTASADSAAVSAAIKKLHGKALQAEVYKQQLEDFKTQHTANEVTAMLDKAKADKKITAQQHTVFAKQFADNPEDLKEVLDTMGAFASVTSKLNTVDRPDGQYTPQVAALMAKGWTALMQSGEMATLKSLSADAYGDMFELKFKRRP